MFILMQWHPATIACKLHGGIEKGHCKRPPLPQVCKILLKLYSSKCTYYYSIYISALFFFLSNYDTIRAFLWLIIKEKFFFMNDY